MNKNLEEALKYPQLGWYVIPVHASKNGKCTCGNPNCRSIGKHPILKHGVNEASRDIKTIENWFTRHSFANIGIATGKISGIVVLDIDVKNNGFDSLEQLLRENGELPKTPTVITGSGGCHYYFRYPDIELKNRVNIMSGLDFRTNGGYIVAPPSIHSSGNQYKWANKLSLEDIEIADMPVWLMEFVFNYKEPKKKKDTEEKLNTNINDSDVITEGGRNAALASIAGKLRREGLNEEQIYQELLKINSERCKPSLEETEIEVIAQSIAKYNNDNLINFPLNDIGNSQRLAFKYGHLFKYCIEKQAWLVWKGKKWIFDKEVQMMTFAKNMLTDFYNEVKNYGKK